MKETLQQISQYFSFVEPWMVQAFVIIFFFTLVNFVQKIILNRLHKRLLRTNNTWDDAFIEALKRPLSLLLWVVGLTLAADIVHDTTKAPIFELVEPIRQIGIIACLIWFSVRLAVNVENNYVEKRNITDATELTSVQAIGKLVRLALILTGGLIVLQTLGISISGVLAFGGIGGVAVGFASKDLLANFFGGLMIYMDRPFEVGNWIRSPDREIEGVVEDIGWRLTRIRTFEKRLLYVPNSIFTNIVVENPSRMSHRRISETVGIRYLDIQKLPAVINDVRNYLHSSEDIDQNQTIIVNFNAFAGSSLDFMVYAYTRTTNWIEYHAVKERVLLKISEIIEQHGAEVAFPTQTLHMPDEITIAKN
ncbi:MAG: mechanosensitive ion channel family protein [Gammaproteobacteria bacterium]|nr:mechanosensitive ion channel family protein [Gammaproteobacteria bacterium]